MNKSWGNETVTPEGTIREVREFYNPEIVFKGLKFKPQNRWLKEQLRHSTEQWVMD